MVYRPDWLSKLVIMALLFGVSFLPCTGLAKVNEIKHSNSHFGLMHPESLYGQALADLNIYWSRPHTGEFIWGEIENSHGHYDWADADEYIKKAQRQKLNLLVTIWPYAEWDQTDCHEKITVTQQAAFPNLGAYRQKPCDLKRYRAWVRTAVERYDGDGKKDMPGLRYPVSYWETLNEPSWQSDELVFFAGGAKDFGHILRATHKAVKRADRLAYITNGGLDRASTSSYEYFEQAFQRNGGKKYFNIFSFHSIGGALDLGVNSILEFASRNNLADRPAWLTELEFSALAAFGTDTATPADWGDYIVKKYVTTFELGVDRIFYVGTPQSPADEETWLIAANGDEQYMYTVFQVLVEKLDYFVAAEQLSDTIYEFTFADGSTRLVAWGNGGLAVEDDVRVTVTTVDGVSSEQLLSEIELTASPIYIDFN